MLIFLMVPMSPTWITLCRILDYVAEYRVIYHPEVLPRMEIYFAVLTNDLTAEFNEDLLPPFIHYSWQSAG